MQQKKITTFLFYLILSLPVFSSNLIFNTSGIEYCANSFVTCAHNVTNVLCTTSLEQCISEYGYNPYNKPLDCFLSESAWTNLYITCAFSGGIFLFSNIFWPALLKASAKCITSLAEVDAVEHPHVKSIGKFLLFFTDADGDGVVTATELITPQTIFTFASALLPIYPWVDANNAQAHCNYQLSLLR